MKQLYCCRCGTKTMNLESGSSIKKGTLTICNDCADPSIDTSLKQTNTWDDSSAVNDLMNLFGIRR